MTAATTAPPKLLTADEFDAEYGHLSGVELVDGIVEELPMPGFEHGEVATELGLELGIWKRKTRLGRVAGNDSFVRLNDGTVRGPDIIYISYARMPAEVRSPKGMLKHTPELVVEVRSPSDRPGRVDGKVEEYLESGIDAVLVIDPAVRSASLHRKGELPQVFDNGDDLTIPDILPGFSVKLASLFE